MIKHILFFFKYNWIGWYSLKIKDIRNQLLDLDFKIVLKHNEINIINYIELLDFNENMIKIKYNEGILKVEGKDLKLKIYIIMTIIKII